MPERCNQVTREDSKSSEVRGLERGHGEDRILVRPSMGSKRGNTAAFTPSIIFSPNVSTRIQGNNFIHKLKKGLTKLVV